MSAYGYSGFGSYADLYGGGGFSGYDGFEEHDDGEYDGFNDFYGYGSFGNYDLFAGYYGDGGGYGIYGGSSGGNRLTEENVWRVDGREKVEWDRVNGRWEGELEEWRWY